MSQQQAVVLGAVTALALSNRDYRRRDEDDRRAAVRQSDDALAIARQGHALIDSLIKSGDIVRIGVDTVSDFDLGLAYGGNQEDAPPSPLPSTPNAFNRPVVTEALAVAPQQWPPAANSYDKSGNVENSSQWLDGQNALTGLLLGYAETRAFMAGLPRGAHPSSFVLAQYFRAAKGLSNALEVGAGQAQPLTQQQYDAAWQRLFGLSPNAYPAGVVYAQVSDGAILANTTAEVTLAVVPWPHGLLGKVGEVAEVIFGGVVAGSATLTGRIRFDGQAGNAALAQLAFPVTTTTSKQQRLLITRRADAGGNEVYEVASNESDVLVTDIVTIVPGTDHTLVWSGQWATAATTNTAVAKTAVLRKY